MTSTRSTFRWPNEVNFRLLRRSRPARRTTAMEPKLGSSARSRITSLIRLSRQNSVTWLTKCANSMWKSVFGRLCAGAEAACRSRAPAGRRRCGRLLGVAQHVAAVELVEPVGALAAGQPDRAGLEQLLELLHDAEDADPLVLVDVVEVADGDDPLGVDVLVVRRDALRDLRRRRTPGRPPGRRRPARRGRGRAGAGRRRRRRAAASTRSSIWPVELLGQRRVGDQAAGEPVGDLLAQRRGCGRAAPGSPSRSASSCLLCFVSLGAPLRVRRGRLLGRRSSAPAWTGLPPAGLLGHRRPSSGSSSAGSPGSTGAGPSTISPGARTSTWPSVRPCRPASSWCHRVVRVVVRAVDRRDRWRLRPGTPGRRRPASTGVPGRRRSGAGCPAPPDGTGGQRPGLPGHGEAIPAPGQLRPGRNRSTVRAHAGQRRRVEPDGAANSSNSSPAVGHVPDANCCWSGNSSRSIDWYGCTGWLVPPVITLAAFSRCRDMGRQRRGAPAR